MRYSLDDVAMINQNYSQVVDDKIERVICNSNGELKILNCNPNILEEVLSCITDNRTFRDIETILAVKYSLDDIIEFLQILLDERILIKKQQDIKSTEVEKSNILVIGGGEIFETLKKMDLDTMSLEKFIIDGLEKEHNFIILTPNQVSYKDIIEINKKLHRNKKKFIPIYFDGVKIVVGPLIIPGKTLCLECIISHELKLLNKNFTKEEQLKLDNILKLNFSYSLNSKFSHNEI